MEPITRTQVIGKLGEHLSHRLTLAELVDWAEQAMMEGDFDGDAAVRDVVARIGVADVRTLGLRWEEFEELAGRLGYRAEVTLRPATGS